MTGYISTNFNWQNDFRKNSIYQNTEIKFDQSKGKNKGTILLIHGTTSQNIDGQIVKANKEQHPNNSEPIFLILSQELNKLGWNTVRYTRAGVYKNDVNLEEYRQTDLPNLVTQLKGIWEMMPEGLPKIIFAWSGGSIHASQLPLSESDGIIFLGGIASNRKDVYRTDAARINQTADLEKYLADVENQRKTTPRNEMHGSIMPIGRFWDEDDLNDNWQYFSPHSDLPLLILHGEKDEECDVSQAEIWKEKLPSHDIKVVIKPGANHTLGVNEKHGMDDVAKEINLWLNEKILEN